MYSYCMAVTVFSANCVLLTKTDMIPLFMMSKGRNGVVDKVVNSRWVKLY